MDNIELNDAFVNINNSPTKVNVYNKASAEHGEEDKTICYNDHPVNKKSHCIYHLTCNVHST